jgi:Fuc2NAc and GlcNAc transferase
MPLNVAGASAVCVAVFLAAWKLTAQFRRYALARELIDVPNARSSHAVATPRGGGMAIVLTTIAGLFALAWLGTLSWPNAAALIGGGSGVAVIGFIDDHGDLAVQWRLLAHFAAAAVVMLVLGGVPPLSIAGTAIAPGWIGNAIALIVAVWLINLTNFMDGIDAIAGVEAVTVCSAGACLYATTQGSDGRWIAPLVVAAATVGFLVWNWPPARIFMGDGGSGFLGLMFAGLSLQAAWVDPDLLWAWLILLGVFVVDATMTLTLRTARGAVLFRPHRTHAYQHAARRLGRHLPVTLGVAAVNVFWLWPLALLVARGSIEGVVALPIAYAPLAAAGLCLGAGAPERSSVMSANRAGD